MDRVSSWMAFAQRPREAGGLGLQPHGASGLVGNLVRESGPDLNPWGPSGDNGTAWGTAQWRGDRLANLQNFAQRQGLDPRSTEAQQAFMRHEFDTSENGAYQRLASAASPEEAASAVNRYYERSADNTGGREKSARELFSKFAGTDGVNAIDTAMGFAPSSSSKPSGPAMAFNNTPPPDDGFLGQLANYGGSASNGGYTVADALGNAGVAMMSLDNAKGAAALAANLASTKKAAAKTGGEYAYDPKSGTFYRTNAQGQLETTQNPNFSDEAAKPKLTEKALQNASESVEKYGTIASINQNAADVLDDLHTGKLNLGVFKNWVNSGQNMAGISDEQSRAFARYQQFLQKVANDNLLLNKGVQTEGDAYREMKSIAAGGANYDNEAAKEALKKLISRGQEAVTQRGRSILDSHVATYGEAPFKPLIDQADRWKTGYDAINKRIEGYGSPAAAAPSAPAGGFRVIKGPH